MWGTSRSSRLQHGLRRSAAWHLVRRSRRFSGSKGDSARGPSEKQRTSVVGRHDKQLRAVFFREGETLRRIWMRRGSRIDFAPNSLLRSKTRNKFPAWAKKFSARPLRELSRKSLNSQMFSGRIFAKNG